MDRFQQVTRAFALGVCVAVGGGCVNTRPFGDMQPAKTTPAATPSGDAKVDPKVQQAGAKAPATLPTSPIAALAKSVARDPGRGAATEIFVAWQNKVAQLPDPTRNGAPIHGVVGQLFLFSADSKAAMANGQLVVEMYDITTRPDGPRLGTWTFDKDTLKKFVTMDERFGKCYAIFLPWPEYDPAVGRVKLKVRFDPERGYPLFTPESPLTFDKGTNSSVINRTQTLNPGLSMAGGFGGISAIPSAPPASLPPLDPVPIGGRNVPPNPSATPTPSNLPPLVITAPGR